MDKNAVRKYAVWARTELIARICQSADNYKITAEANRNLNADDTLDNALTAIQKSQRHAAIARIHKMGFMDVIEEISYAWFIRFSALRYMEVNNYLPSCIRVFTDESGRFKPQILTKATHLNLDGLDMKKVYTLKEQGDNDALYKYLLITQCNALRTVLPQMFKSLDGTCKKEEDDYTVLLFPNHLLRTGSVVEQMVSLISEDHWVGNIQMIGWLHQYYNADTKSKVFADLKKKIKITKNNIPAATQLFTPDWITHYMVENSLGRLWLEGHPNGKLTPEWKYYMNEATQKANAQAQLAKIRKEYSVLKPEDILCIDPCMGSGHILVYMFDVLMKIYEANGFSPHESVERIIKYNLFGLDIDDRVAQLAYFAVIMKAQQYDNHFLKRSEIPQPHVYSIKESNHLNRGMVTYFCNGDKKLNAAMDLLLEEMRDASEYGSILHITSVDFAALYTRFDKIKSEDSLYQEAVLDELLPFVRIAEMLARQYNVVVTNPPYLAISNGDYTLNTYVKANYFDSKADLYAVFIERCIGFAKTNAFVGMITQHSWMFLSAFEKLRSHVLRNNIVNMVHLGAHAFEEIGGEVVQTVAFILRKTHVPEYQVVFRRLVDEISQNAKEKIFLSGKHSYIRATDSFGSVPGTPFAYWASKNIFADFESGTPLKKIAEPKSGLSTTDNQRFLRFWHECDFAKISFNISDVEETVDATKWFPMAKGGRYRKWYGNNDYIVNWWCNGKDLKDATKGATGGRIVNPEYYFKKLVTWSGISSGEPSMRISEHAIFGSGAKALFSSNGLHTYLAFLNSKVAPIILQFLSPTLNNEAGHIGNIPVCFEPYEKVENITCKCIALSRDDWDSFENSWDFVCHPLVHSCKTIADSYRRWKQEANNRFQSLKANEEKLNRFFIDIYRLQDELKAEIEDRSITVRKADLRREIKSLISYAVGCMFGRYSLDMKGLAFAGGGWNASRYYTFEANKDNVIPICDSEYFENDIICLFVRFLEAAYGKDTLDKNLRFIADALGGKGTPTEIIRNYFLNDFFHDHCKIYYKRPIYWLFDSGKKNAFKALLYVHRYQPDIVAHIHTDYVHELQCRYRTAITDCENHYAVASASVQVCLDKQLSKLQDQSAEIHIYEEKIRHLANCMIEIDLDNGVKHNYQLFQNILAEIK